MVTCTKPKVLMNHHITEEPLQSPQPTLFGKPFVAPNYLLVGPPPVAPPSLIAATFVAGRPLPDASTPRMTTPVETNQPYQQPLLLPKPIVGGGKQIASMSPPPSSFDEVVPLATKKQWVGDMDVTAVVTATEPQSLSSVMEHRHKNDCVAIAPRPKVVSHTFLAATTASSALEMFLNAVAVATHESKQTGNNATSPMDEMTAEEQLHFRRECNRYLAKQTRKRKKVQMTVLKEQFQVLERENVMLKQIVLDDVQPKMETKKEKKKEINK